MSDRLQRVQQQSVEVWWMLIDWAHEYKDAVKPNDNNPDDDGIILLMMMMMAMMTILTCL